MKSLSSLYYRFPTLYEFAFKFPPQGYWRWKSYRSLLRQIQHSAFSIQHSEFSTPHSALRIPNYTKGIEVGCGAGVLAKALVEKFPTLSLTSIDLSLEMVEFAKRKNGHPRIRFLHRDFFKLTGTYDLLVSAYAWVFFPLEESVEKIMGLLEPKGKFFILNVGLSPFTQVYFPWLRRILRTSIYFHHPITFQDILHEKGFNTHWVLIDSFEGSYLIFGQRSD